MDRLNTSSVGRVKDLPAPVDMLVTGSVPAGSGLSSSAAMVVASTLAFLAVNGKLDVPDPVGANASRRLTKGELVEMAVENEKRVGVNSGGFVRYHESPSFHFPFVFPPLLFFDHLTRVP